MTKPANLQHVVDEINMLQMKAENSDFFSKIEIYDQILEIKRNNGLISAPDDDNYECLGCGS